MPPKSNIAKSSGARLRITLIKSPIGNLARHKRTVRALGFRRVHETVEQPDSPTTRGMIATVSHLVRVEELQ